MSELSKLVASVRATKDYARLAEYSPYAQLLGIRFSEEQDGRLLFQLDYHPENIGNSRLPALHGGVIAAFMEHSDRKSVV